MFFRFESVRVPWRGFELQFRSVGLRFWAELSLAHSFSMEMNRYLEEKPQNTPPGPLHSLVYVTVPLPLLMS